VKPDVAPESVVDIGPDMVLQPGKLKSGDVLEV